MLIILITTIISWILVKYQQAIGCARHNNPGGSALASDSSMAACSASSCSPSPASTGNGTPTRAQCTGFAVVHMPISMGTFSIEDQSVQVALRNQLVLTELKNLGSLLKPRAKTLQMA